jgi:putative membrane-bound dehydrogenase-like protein
VKQKWLLIPFTLVLGSSHTGYAQTLPERAVSTFTVSQGLEISLWASEPLFANPTCIDIDHKGRIWVCESVNYRHKLHRRPPNRPEGDRILILEDTKGTGKADKVTTFYQSTETLAPLGIAVAKDPIGPGYKIFVCQSPDILLFEDKDGDGQADGPPKKLLSGFGGIDHDHGVHGILIGPDGKLYFSVGDQGVNSLVDKRGRKWTTNRTDCQAGTIWRCDLDGSNLELIAHNFRNEYEPCVDSFGTVFVSDNDDDGNQQTRICYVMPGGNYGYWPRGRGESHWHEEQPGVVPKILRTYFGSPTGMCVYEGTLLPEKYRGQLLHTDAGPRHLRCYHLTPDGAGYAVEREDMLTSTDSWFRPSDVCVAPDGSVFIADWYDPGVGGHGMGDITRGRIFRLTPKGHQGYRVPALDFETKEGILAALASPALSVRYMATTLLRGGSSRIPGNAIVESALNQKSNPFLRARALWQLACVPPSTREQYLRSALLDPDPRFRTCAIRVLKDCGTSPADYSVAQRQRLLTDPSSAVRREALLALRDVEAPIAKPLILDLAKRYDGTDRFYLEAIGIAVGQDRARRTVILSDFEKQFPGWNKTIAGLIWELQPPGALPLLRDRLLDPALAAAERTKALDILANSDDPRAGDVLLKALAAELPQSVQDGIVEHLSRLLAGKWAALRNSPELTATIRQLLDHQKTPVSALRLIGAADKTDAAAEVSRLARDNLQSLALRCVATQTLGSLASAEAVNALCLLLKDSATPAAQRAEVVQALRRQAGRSADSRASELALHCLRDLVLSKHGDLALQQVGATALAGTRPGSIWLLAAGAKKELPEKLTPFVGRLLRNSAYADLRSQALLAFPPPSRLDPKRLPTITGLVTRRGDPVQGKRLIAASARSELQCLKCHTIGGIGGNIGPDLSVIGLKASRENLLESLLFPSKAIADQYATWIIGTKSDLVVAGLLVEETPEYVVLRDANGKDSKIQKKQIATRHKSLDSLMPNDLIAYMSEEDLVDVVEYLLELKVQTEKK